MLLLPTPTPVPDTAMNYVGNSNDEMLRLIQILQKQMTMLGNNPPPNPSDQLQNRVRHQSANVSKYCWYHGACAHASLACTSKRQGHKDDTTFANKMIVSMYYCQSVAVTPAPESTRRCVIDES